MKGKAQKVEKILTAAQRTEYEKESELIRENTKTVKYPHKFEGAKYTHPNGHPRCIHCGDEELVDEQGKQLPCEKPVVEKNVAAQFTIIKIDKKKQMVGGVVYEPDEVDTQDDFATKEEIEKAMYRFMEKYATNTKRIRINHMGKKHFFPIIESFVPDEDTIKGDQSLKKGAWWLMVKVTSDKIWKDIESGKLTGFSMGGTAKA